LREENIKDHQSWPEWLEHTPHPDYGGIHFSGKMYEFTSQVNRLIETLSYLPIPGFTPYRDACLPIEMLRFWPWGDIWLCGGGNGEHTPS
jgi:hypothetical protein